MSRRPGSASKMRGVAASSRDTGLTLFDMTTCEPSAPTPRALTSSAAGSPAKTCLSRGKALASQARAAVCGSSSRASLASFDPVSSSWKTSQRSCLGGWTSFSETFPKRGMMRSGSISVLPTSERRTGESGCSSSRGGETWPTATAGDANGSGSRNTPTSRAHAGVSLTDAVRGDGGTGRAWPTLTVQDERHTTISPAEAARHSPTLATMAMLSQGSAWPTPAARDFKDTGTSPSEFERNTPGLAARAGGSLNPDWVEQLMGFPAGWTSPLTDGPQAPAKRSTKAKRRASRPSDDSDGND